jgi:hypothetical protein
MTSADSDRPVESAVERWFDDRRRDLIIDLIAIMDLDAGVRDAMTPARHRDLVTDLTAVLDLDAGLAAIVRPPWVETGPEPGRIDQARPVSNTGDLIDVIAAAAPTLRLALRVPMRRLASVLTLVSEIITAHGHARLLLRHLGYVHRHADRDAAGRARDTARDLDRALDRALGSDRNAAGKFGPGLLRELTGDLAPARQLARAVTRTDPDAPRDVARLHRFAGKATTGSGLGDDVARAFEQARSRLLDVTRELADRLAIGDALGRPIHLIYVGSDDPIRLRRLMDDLTGADLRDADLTGVDLDGVRWSDSTRWPEAWIDWVRQHSVPAGAGVYVIRLGNTTDDRTLIPH